MLQHHSFSPQLRFHLLWKLSIVLLSYCNTPYFPLAKYSSHCIGIADFLVCLFLEFLGSTDYILFNFLSPAFSLVPGCRFSINILMNGLWDEYYICLTFYFRGSTTGLYVTYCSNNSDFSLCISLNSLACVFLVNLPFGDCGGAGVCLCITKTPSSIHCFCFLP